MKKEQLTTESGRIMVIVPHQDDEVLLAAGVLMQAAACGLAVQVVMATNGDYGSSDYRIGQTRLGETLRGLSLIPVLQKDVVFLGYADTGMPPEESFLTRLYLETDANRILPSHCSGQTYGLDSLPDYHTLHYGCPAAYTRSSFLSDLTECISAFQPDLIFTTCAEDTHGDHSALFYFVVEALRQWRQDTGRTDCSPGLYAGLVHSCAGDDIWPLRSGSGRAACFPDTPPDNRQLFYPDAFTCPPGLEKTGALRWEERISFTVPDPARKARMLSAHVTALKPDAVDFLCAFLRPEELFWQINWHE